MTDTRVVNYADIYLETPKLALAEQFVAAEEELDELPDEERSECVSQIARMATAAEVFIFDKEVGTVHVNCQVYELNEDEEKGILLFAEKTEAGIVSSIYWIDPDGLLEAGFSHKELMGLGFSATP